MLSWLKNNQVKAFYLMDVFKTKFLAFPFEFPQQNNFDGVRDEHDEQ